MVETRLVPAEGFRLISKFSTMTSIDSRSGLKLRQQKMKYFISLYVEAFILGLSCGLQVWSCFSLSSNAMKISDHANLINLLSTVIL